MYDVSIFGFLFQCLKNFELTLAGSIRSVLHFFSVSSKIFELKDWKAAFYSRRNINEYYKYHYDVEQLFPFI